MDEGGRIEVIGRALECVFLMCLSPRGQAFVCCTVAAFSEHHKGGFIYA